MNFSVIPFFLVASVTPPSDPNLQQVSINPSSALYTYNGGVHVKMARTFEPAVYLDVEGKVKCRNKNDNQLICQISDTTVDCSFRPARHLIEEIVDNMKAPFQINFNEKGVESIDISATKYESVVYLKMIASMFHVGAELNRENLDFESRENNTFGPCNTKFNIERTSSSSNTDKKYSLHVLPFQGDDSFNTLNITKISQPKNCPKLHRLEGSGPVRTTFKPFKSNMYITNTGLFQSNRTVENMRIYETENERIRGTVRSVITMELESIEMTEDDLPTLPPDSRNIDLTVPDLSDTEQTYHSVLDEE